MYLGVAYYAEEWGAERWETDADLMAEAGLTLVRLADMGWSSLEPGRDQFTFDWLDQVIETMWARGIGVLLATPTAVVPRWLVSEDPLVMTVDDVGHRSAYGTWRNYCVSGGLYRERARIIAAALAQRYGSHPAIVGWQVDNELSMGTTRCFCDRCSAGFRAWAQRRYGDLDSLNEVWGMVSFGHRYDRWEQLETPKRHWTRHNPALMLDFCRFTSDNISSFVAEQGAEIKARALPGQRVTHNQLGGALASHVDHHELARHLDVHGWDNYLDPAGGPVTPALEHDFARSVKHAGYWVLEQLAGCLPWHPYRALRPGHARAMTYQSVARGAEAVVYFRWRSGRVGAEQYLSGLLGHDGAPTRTYREVKRLAGELDDLKERLAGTLPVPAVGMVFDASSAWSLAEQPHHKSLTAPDGYFQPCYAALFRLGMPVEFVRDGEDLTPYRLLIAPALHLPSASMAQALTEYVRGGGVLLLTARSGFKDEHNNVVTDPLPGLLRPLVGATITEFDSVPAGVTNALETSAELDGGRYPSHSWCEILRPEADDVQVLARYTEDYYAGEPAAVARRHGRGWVVYLGTFSDESFDLALMRLLAERAGLGRREPLPPGMEVVTRSGPTGGVTFVINHTDTEQTATLGLDAEPRTVAVGPHDVLVL